MLGAWPVDSADGLRPPSLPTGASTVKGPSIFFLVDIIVPVSPRTNGCPEKPGATQDMLKAGSSTGPGVRSPDPLSAPARNPQLSVAACPRISRFRTTKHSRSLRESGFFVARSHELLDMLVTVQVTSLRAPGSASQRETDLTRGGRNYHSRETAKALDDGVWKVDIITLARRRLRGEDASLGLHRPAGTQGFDCAQVVQQLRQRLRGHVVAQQLARRRHLARSG